jgi:hypothetical protein
MFQVGDEVVLQIEALSDIFTSPIRAFEYTGLLERCLTILAARRKQLSLAGDHRIYLWRI